MSARRPGWSLIVAGAGVAASISPAAAFTWDAPKALTPSGHDVQDGSWRVLYTRCLASPCTSAAIFRRTAPDARTWSTQLRVTPGAGPGGVAGGSVVAGKLIVAYDRVRTNSTEDVLVRTGS